MAIKIGYRVRQAIPGDHDQIAQLISIGSFVHRHLDWRTPLEWIGFQPYLVIEQNGQIKSVLACPPDPPLIDWIRVFATNADFPAEQAWIILWENVLRSMETENDRKVAAIVLEKPFRKLLLQSSFTCHQEIVMLTWLGERINAVNPYAGFQIRDMLESDIPNVAELDAAAFDPVWRNSPSALYKAFHQAAVPTIVENDGVILGYQLSTKNMFGGHLARLAVHPVMQGKGIGYFLVNDMIKKLTRIGITTITVNTQSDNFTSLALYKRLGFRETGVRYPVFIYDVIK